MLYRYLSRAPASDRTVRASYGWTNVIYYCRYDRGPRPKSFRVANLGGWREAKNVASGPHILKYYYWSACEPVSNVMIRRRERRGIRAYT